MYENVIMAALGVGAVYGAVRLVWSFYDWAHGRGWEAASRWKNEYNRDNRLHDLENKIKK